MPRPRKELAAKNPVRLEEVSDRLFLMSSRRYRQLVKERGFPPVVNGVIDLLPAVEAVIRYYHDLAESPGSLSLTEERARLTRLQADKRQIEIQEKLGKLVDADIARERWAQVLQAIRSKLLQTPGRLAPVVIGCETPDEVKRVAERIIAEVMEELANPELVSSEKRHKSRPKSKAKRARRRS